MAKTAAKRDESIASPEAEAWGLKNGFTHQMMYMDPDALMAAFEKAKVEEMTEANQARRGAPARYNMELCIKTLNPIKKELLALETNKQKKEKALEQLNSKKVVQTGGKNGENKGEPLTDGQLDSVLEKMEIIKKVKRGPHEGRPSKAELNQVQLAIQAELAALGLVEVPQNDLAALQAEQAKENEVQAGLKEVAKEMEAEIASLEAKKSSLVRLQAKIAEKTQTIALLEAKIRDLKGQEPADPGLQGRMAI